MYTHCLICGKLASLYWGSNARIRHAIARRGCCPECDQSAREENAIHDREQGQMLRTEGYRQPEPDEEIDQVLVAAGKEWVM